MGTITPEEKVNIYERLTKIEVTQTEGFGYLKERFNDVIRSSDAVSKRLGEALDIAADAQRRSKDNEELLEKLRVDVSENTYLRRMIITLGGGSLTTAAIALIKAFEII
jgi:hypothetical protein